MPLDQQVAARILLVRGVPLIGHHDHRVLGSGSQYGEGSSTTAAIAGAAGRAGVWIVEEYS